VATSPVRRVTVYVFPLPGALSSAIADWAGTADNTVAVTARASAHVVLFTIVLLTGSVA
jgi:hypothetical protein